jgi:hypothetical protein
MRNFSFLCKNVKNRNLFNFTGSKNSPKCLYVSNLTQRTDKNLNLGSLIIFREKKFLQISITSFKMIISRFFKNEMLSFKYKYKLIALNFSVRKKSLRKSTKNKNSLKLLETSAGLRLEEARGGVKFKNQLQSL